MTILTDNGRVRLTASEYARGLLSWQPIDGVSLQVGTAPDAQSPKVWSPTLQDPTGTPVPIDLQRVFTFKVWLGGREAISVPEFWIRLERVEKAVVISRVFHGLADLKVTLRHVPDYGNYHRLVLDAGSFTWDEDVVFRELGILVRFVAGEIEGERTTALKAAAPDEKGEPTLEGQAETARATGRFIEVVTPGKSAQQAEAHAYATLGLLAVALGPSLLGRLVFSESWDASPTGQNGAAIVTGAAFARHALQTEFDAVDALLFRMTVDDPIAQARVLALRWYERGSRASAPLDKLLSFYIGVETLVQAFATQNAPLPVEKARTSENVQIQKLIASAKLDKKVLDRVANRLSGASLREQFDFFASEHGLIAADTRRFDKTKRFRDKAVHGTAAEVTFEVASDAEQLLRSMLKSVFDLENEFAWETQPVIHQIKLHFALTRAADQGGGLI
jgi:hypothetical protein